MSSADLPGFISTGRLPTANQVQELVDASYALHDPVTDGRNSTVYPALTRVSEDLFGICVADTQGNLYEAGDVDTPFTIMSVAKPFVFALVCELLGPDASREKLGVNATGRAFNSFAALELGPDARTNPMVNAGAIATASLAPGDTLEERWEFIVGGLSRFAGRRLSLNGEVLESASATNHTNRGTASLLVNFDRLYSEPVDAVELYTRQSCLDVTARDLAVMGATLADGGLNPVTGDQVVSVDTCSHTLAVMATAGLYEASGDWLYQVGLPGKSGIGGGIVTSAPGKGGLGTYAPRLDGFGNSVKGQLVARHLSSALGLNLFVSRPDVRQD